MVYNGVSHHPGDRPMPDASTYDAFIRKEAAALRASATAPATLAEWQARRAKLRETMLAAMGSLPREDCPLAPKQVGTLKREGYRIEKLLFQSRPDVWVTASAYVPEGVAGKVPGVLVVHGHWPWARRDPVVQARCLGLVKLGFFVLAVDAFSPARRHPTVARGTYHGALLGSTLWPAGMTLLGVQVHENRRAVDYLLTRPEVDGAKLGITGASGGGNQSMYAGALDDRFGCVVPVCSVGTYRSYLGVAACVCEIVPDVMTYTEEWGLLAMVAPRALLVINATKDSFVFSVGEAQQSIAKAQHVFRLHGAAGKVAHAIFESGHDYGKEMREAMYGWMTLHLKGEGKGNPIPEPELKPEDPETLRCWPGESRPDDFVTLPRFAAREAARLIDEHNRSLPRHREDWNNMAMRMRHTLEHHVLGGFPQQPAGALVRAQTVEESVPQFTMETEPGITIGVTTRGIKSPKRLMILLDLESRDSPAKDRLVEEFSKGDGELARIAVRATREFAVPGDAIGRAP